MTDTPRPKLTLKLAPAKTAVIKEKLSLVLGNSSDKVKSDKLEPGGAKTKGASNGKKAKSSKEAPKSPSKGKKAKEAASKGAPFTAKKAKPKPPPQKRKPKKELIMPIAEYEQILGFMERHYPLCFSGKTPKPLAIGLHQELTALGPDFKAKEEEPLPEALCSARKLRHFLKVYTRKKLYLEALVPGAERVNLAGETTDIVTEEQVMGKKVKAKPKVQEKSVKKEEEVKVEDKANAPDKTDLPSAPGLK